MNLQTRTNRPESPSQHERPWDRLIIGWQAVTLDTELAAGRSPDDTRLLTLRAVQLVAPANRTRLAKQWEALLARASGTHSVGYSRQPLRRAAILAATPDVLAMVDALRSPVPVPVSGVAMSSLLLIDGTGPVYRSRGGRDLAADIRSALRHLDPAAELATVR
jgi:hypothetical protein